MTWALAKDSTARALRLAWLLAACSVVLALLPVPAQRASAAVRAADDFDRADGSLGRNWTGIRDGALSISSHAATGRGGLAGDIWTGGTFARDQYSQIEVRSKRLTAGQWIGAAVRVRDGGLDGYAGIYLSDGGRPELQLYKRSGGSWILLGTYRSGPLPAGTQLKLMAIGSAILFLENGLLRLSASDTSIPGGAPGIMIYGSGAASGWSGGDVPGTAAGFRVLPAGSDAHGVRSYRVLSASNGPGPQVMRVLAPTHPARGVPHNFLYVLPVQLGLGKEFNDGLDTLHRLDAQDRYNLTIIEPTFGIDPWYANNPRNRDVQYETFMTRVVVPWVEKNLATTGREQNWLLGFSKSGLGGQELILKHPGIFALAASWDFPADMSSYNQLGPDPAASYGTDANFQANYRLTPAFVKARKEPFLTQRRIWIGGNRSFPVGMSYYAALLTKEHILYARDSVSLGHQWDTGWVPLALAALRRDSINFRPEDMNPRPAARTPSRSYPMSIRWLYK
jgi:Putative esterase